MELVSRRSGLIGPWSGLHVSSPTATSFGASRSRVRIPEELRKSSSLPFLHKYGRSRSTPAIPSPVASTTALALLNQQTARGWLRSYDDRLSQNFWSKQLSSSRRAKENTRLPPVASTTAMRENFKSQHYATELDRITSANLPKRVRSKDSEGRSRGSKEFASLEELEKEVKAGIPLHHEIDAMMQEAANQHKNNMKHMQPGIIAKETNEETQEDTRRLGEQQELLKLAAKAKKTRKKTDRPSDPRWRVEERLKREKEMMKDRGEPPLCAQNLPMTQFAIQSDHGKQEHALVDIQAIQAKCRGLDASCTAKSLLEKQRLREVAEAEAGKKQSNPACPEELAAFAELTWEDRVENAQRRKLESHVNSVFNKMSQMRSKYPKDIPDSLLNPLHAMQQGDYSWHEGDY